MIAFLLNSLLLVSAQYISMPSAFDPLDTYIAPTRTSLVSFDPSVTTAIDSYPTEPIVPVPPVDSTNAPQPEPTFPSASYEPSYEPTSHQTSYAPVVASTSYELPQVTTTSWPVKNVEGNSPGIAEVTVMETFVVTVPCSTRSPTRATAPEPWPLSTEVPSDDNFDAEDQPTEEDPASKCDPDITTTATVLTTHIVESTVFVTSIRSVTVSK